MKRSVNGIVAVMIAITILLSSCSPASKASTSYETTNPTVEPSTIAPAEILNLNVEQAYVGKIMGGIFYTINSNNPQHHDYNEIRKHSIQLLSDTIEKTIIEANFVSKGLHGYKNLLLEALDSSISDSNSTLFEITKGILTYETAINATQIEIEKFLSIKPQDELSKATLDMYLLESLTQLIHHQKNYLSWLIGSTEISLAMIEKTDPIKSSELIHSFVNDFSNNLSEPIKALQKKYCQAAEIYTYILSADYHTSEYYLNEISQRLELLDPQKKEALKEPIDLYYEIMQQNRRAPIIIDLSDNDALSYQSSQAKASLMSLSVAQDAEASYNDYFTNAIAISLLRELQDKISDRDWDREMDWSVQQILIEDLLLNTELTENIKASYENQADNLINLEFRRRLVQTYPNEEAQGEASTEDIARIKEQVAAMENAASQSMQRQEIIDRINLGQNTLNSLAFIGDDARYAMMIEMINVIIAEGKSNGLDHEKTKNISTLINNNLGEMPQPTSAPEEEPTSPSQPAIKGYWELVETEEVIPQEYTTGDDKDTRKYTFEYSDGTISCNYTRIVYDGIKKTYLTELIDTSGGWSLAIDDDAYLPDEKVKLTLNANIDHFQRLTTPESGGSGTNQTGVAVWAYIGNINTPFGNATSGVLESHEGDSTCRATISEGKIALASVTLEVSSVFGLGKNNEQKVLFVVVSNQGRIGGIKYIYEYHD